MSRIDFTGGILSSTGLGRFIPEPKSRVSGFGSVLKSVGSALEGGARSLLGLEPEYQALLEKQIEVQQQMQLIAMESNIEKSKHESSMAAIRNMRAN